MTRLFDAFVMVDWSASATPKSGADSIWVASLDVKSGATTLVNHRTRALAERALRSRLIEFPARRVLVGFDFPLGYPLGFARLLGAGHGDWATVWRYLAGSIVDDERNANNRFDVADHMNAWAGPTPGPFWGCPPTRSTPILRPRKDARFPVATVVGELREYRISERRLRDRGLRPFSTWQLYGNGSVGSQALVGIPVVARLRADRDLARRSQVWPFTTGCDSNPTAGLRNAIVHAEIWPGLVPLDRGRHPVKDAAQVIAVCEHLARLDRDGGLGGCFAPALTDAERVAVVREEGWILGVA